MLSLTAEDRDGRQYPLPEPEEITLDRAFGVPADSVAATFSGALPPGLARLRVLLGGRCILDGTVDEQTLRRDTGGSRSSIYARSLCAVLLDTQMKPVTLEQPGTQDVFRLAAEPFGFFHDLPKVLYPGQFLVPAGMSCWSALSSFLRLACGGRLQMEGPLLTLFRLREEPPLQLSNLPGGVPYLSLEQGSRRCGRIAAVRYKTQHGEDYPWEMQNPGAVRDGVSAVRYLNLSGVPAAQWQARLRAVLEQGEAQGADVWLPGMRVQALGSPVALPEDTALETPLYLAALRMVQNSAGTTTRWTLRPAAYFKEEYDVDDKTTDRNPGNVG